VTRGSIRLMKAALWVACLEPAAWLVWAAYGGHFSADPLADITHLTGDWALRFLCITLAITPLRRITGWNDLVRFRRLLGLFAFFYGTLHLLTWVVFDRAGSLDYPNGIVSWTMVRGLAMAAGADIYKRPFITVGMTAFTCMLLLAATSTAGWIRRLGGKRWQALHRLIYPAAVAGVIHYLWLVKSDISRPIAYGLVVTALLGFRVVWSRRRAPAMKRTPLPVPQPRADL